MDRKILILSAIILIILGAFLFEKLQSPLEVRTVVILSEGGTEIGDNATDFILESINGTDIALDKFASQRSLILQFWSSDSVNSLSQLQTIRNFYGDKMEILGIGENLDKNEAVQSTKKLGINFPVLIDITGDVKRAYGVLTLPTTYFVDKQSFIIDKKEGPLTEHELNEKVKILIK